MRMFRAVVLAAAIGAISVADASAQSVIGFRLGASMSKADLSDIEDLEGADKEWLTKFTGGGFIRFGMGGLAIQPELLFVSKGVQFGDPDSDAELAFRFDYVEIPVLLFFGLGTGSIAPYFVVGPAFAFEVACKVEGSDGDADASVDCDEGGEFERNKIDISGVVGAGLTFPVGPGSIVLDGRYTHGFMNIADDDTAPDAELKHRTLSFTAGFQVPLSIR